VACRSNAYRTRTFKNGGMLDLNECIPDEGCRTLTFKNDDMWNEGVQNSSLKNERRPDYCIYYLGGKDGV
jgi:hypothetical protein